MTKFREEAEKYWARAEELEKQADSSYSNNYFLWGKTEQSRASEHGHEPAALCEACESLWEEWTATARQLEWQAGEARGYARLWEALAEEEGEADAGI